MSPLERQLLGDTEWDAFYLPQWALPLDCWLAERDQDHSALS